MKKTLAAIATGALLIAGQAAAANVSAAPTVADRVGAPVGASEEFGGSIAPGLIFAVVAIAAFAAVTAADDDAESD